MLLFSSNFHNRCVHLSERTMYKGENLLAIISKLIPIGVFALSFIGGLLFFYITSNGSKSNKKIQIDQIISELINVILFIWLGKILTNFTLFVQDPLAVLAYPSDSKAFYLAILFSGISLFIKDKKGKVNSVSLMKSFIPVFLVSSFLYEFIQVVWFHNSGTIGYFILITLLIILYYLVHERLNTKILFSVILVGWSFGVIVLTVLQPFVTVFGFIIAPWFVGVFFIVNFILILRKRDVHGWN